MGEFGKWFIDESIPEAEFLVTNSRSVLVSSYSIIFGQLSPSEYSITEYQLTHRLLEFGTKTSVSAFITVSTATLPLEE